MVIMTPFGARVFHSRAPLSRLQAYSLGISVQKDADIAGAYPFRRRKASARPSRVTPHPLFSRSP
jgi:hypothetical protein